VDDDRDVSHAREGYSGAMAVRRGARTVLVLAIVLLVAAVAVVAVFRAVDPFGSETKDRSQPVVLKSLENLSDYHAATANMQVVVDVEEDAKLLPSFIKGERTLFVAAGTVDAAIDFRGLSQDPDAVVVNEDRTAVKLTLPAPKLLPPRLDPDRTRVYDRDRGVLDRVEDAVSDRPGDEQPLYQLATDKLAAAAAADPQLRPTAERNTRSMLTGLLRGLGFDRVTIEFRPPEV
jgi:hypothetical protein